MLVEMLRKRDFEVNIEETLVYSFKVEAADEEEAENIISDKFHNGELTLEDGRKVWGAGKSTNVGRAGIDAIVSALNQV